MQKGFCSECEQCLFDVPDFKAFSEKRPIILTCQGCGTVWLITHQGNIIYYRKKGQLSKEAIKAEQYG